MSSTPSSSTGSSQKSTERPPVAIIILAAALMGFSALHIVWLALKHDPQVHVPVSIALVLAFVMLSGSMMAVLKVTGHGEHMDWLAAPLMLGMTVCFGWVGLFGDPKYCSSRGPIWMPMPSCHVAFTVVSVLMLLVTWLAARTWWRSVVARRSARVE